MTLNKWMGRSQLLPEMFEIVLRPIWWVAGSEQPSSPLHRAAAARLLTGDQHRHSCSVDAAVFVWLTTFCISQFLPNHISAPSRSTLHSTYYQCIMKEKCARTPTNTNNTLMKPIKPIKLLKHQSHVLTASSKFLGAYNVKSSSTNFSDNIQWKCKISFPCARFVIQLG